MKITRFTSIWAFIVLTVFSSSGCESCKRNHPYIPYSLDPSSSSVPSNSSTQTPVDFKVLKAVKAPGNGKKWDLDHFTASPSDDSIFVNGIVFDADEDGNQDLLTWSQKEDKSEGYLLYYNGKYPTSSTVSKQVLALPGIGWKQCEFLPNLSQIAQRTILLDIVADCSKNNISHPMHWVSMVQLQKNKTPESRIQFETGNPSYLGSLAQASKEEFEFQVFPTDFDKDGIEDAGIQFKFYQEREKRKQTVEFNFSFYNRPAGLARDPAEPSASFQKQLQWIRQSARNKSTAQAALDSIQLMRKSIFLICKEFANGSREDLFFTSSTSDFSCNSSSIFDELAFSEELAAFQQGDTPRQMDAIARLDLVSKSKKQMEKEIEAHFEKSIKGVKPRAVGSKKYSFGDIPILLPISFDEKDNLIIKTVDESSKLTKWVSLDASLKESEIGVPKNAKDTIQLGSWFLSGFRSSCKFDRSLTVSLFSLPVTASKQEQLFRLPGMGGLNENGFRVIESECQADRAPRIQPIALSEVLFQFAIGSRVVSIDLAGKSTDKSFEMKDGRLEFGKIPSVLGLSTSPDGLNISLVTTRGILVLSKLTSELWTDPLLSSSLRGCVPSNNASKLACIAKDGQVHFFTRESKSQ